MLRNIFRIWRSGVLDFILSCLLLALTPSLMAQAAGTCGLAGKVTDTSGGAVANVSVTATSGDSGKAQTATTGTEGTYRFNALPPGNYRVKFEAAGFNAVEIPSTTVDGTQTAVLDGKLEQIDSKPTPAQQENLPNAPSSGTTAPSLQDLGIPPEQTQGSVQDQARLDKRTHMLKVHQRLGLITLAPLVATFITSANAGGKNTSTTDRTVHMVLGAVSGDLYFMTAYYAIRAPRVPGTETRGPIRLHKAMAWIHGPGMILTPILGAIAYNQKNNGEKVHGIASAHGPVAIVTGAAFGIAVMSVSFKF